MSSTRLHAKARWCGLVPYADGLGLQDQASNALLADKTLIHLLGLEHPTVITLGRRASKETDVIDGSPLPVHWTERGGQATLHSPGQLVIYPIASLREAGFSVREWVDFLLNTTIQTLRDFGVDATASEGSGLWTKRGKIAFLGLRVSQGISTHGLAINLQNDLSLAGNIRSCGVQGARLDRVLDHGVTVAPEDFFHVWSRYFSTSHLAKSADQACP